MNAFDVLVWAALVRIAARILAGGSPRLWLVFGVVAGLGLLNKLDVGLLGAGLGVGLVLAWRLDAAAHALASGSAARSRSRSFLPHVVWQARHGWPTREFVANAQRAKIAYLGPLGFIAAQFRDVGPVGFTLALAGLGWLLAARRARPFRPLGWAALTVLVVFAASVSKPYYFSPALTVLFAAAGVALEAWTAGRFARPARAAICPRRASSSWPRRSPSRCSPRTPTCGMRPRSASTPSSRRAPSPRAGSRSSSPTCTAGASSRRRWRGSPPRFRRRSAPRPACTATTTARRERSTSSAPELDLPPAISGHNSYWLWGPGVVPRATVLLVIGGEGGEPRALLRARRGRRRLPLRGLHAVRGQPDDLGRARTEGPDRRRSGRRSSASSDRAAGASIRRSPPSERRRPSGLFGPINARRLGRGPSRMIRLSPRVAPGRHRRIRVGPGHAPRVRLVRDGRAGIVG